jgi:acetyl esterase/lipase
VTNNSSNSNPHRVALLIASLILSGIASSRADVPPMPPGQPASGPGSGQYAHSRVISHQYGEGDTEYWIFEPAGPAPDSAPIIVFDHGWTAMDPNIYGMWIEHLVRRGNIVIYPRYQATIRTRMRDFTPNAIAAEKAALTELQNASHVKPQLDHVAIIGHSMGGAMAASMAASAAADGLPVPKAICCVEPDNKFKAAETIHMPMADLSNIPATTLVQVIVGDRDHLAGTETAKEIFAEIKQIPDDKKNFITLVSDDHGSPPLVAGHLAPLAPTQLITYDETLKPGFTPQHSIGTPEDRNTIGTDALDFYGTWKLFDGLTDAAFFGTHLDYALGNKPAQRFMGTWSDGVPVKELIVTTSP